MQYFESESEVEEFLKIEEFLEEHKEENGMSEQEHAIKRLETLELTAKAEARRVLEEKGVDTRLRDGLRTIVNVVNFNKMSPVEICEVLKAHINYLVSYFSEVPVVKRLKMLINSMTHIEEKYNLA